MTHIRLTMTTEASDVLIAAPQEQEEILRSGTWATYRYARKRGIPIYLVLPDGTVKEFNCA